MVRVALGLAEDAEQPAQLVRMVARRPDREVGSAECWQQLELRRLFTFPDDFEFVGRRSSVQAQVGNSVPPLFAQAVARGIAGLGL